MYNTKTTGQIAPEKLLYTFPSLGNHLWLVDRDIIVVDESLSHLLEENNIVWFRVIGVDLPVNCRKHIV